MPFTFTEPDVFLYFTEWALCKVPLPMQDGVALVIDMQAQAFEAGWKAAVLRASDKQDALDT